MAVDAKTLKDRAFLITADERKSVAEVLAERLCTVEAQRDKFAQRLKEAKTHLEVALRCIEEAAPGAFKNGNVPDYSYIDEGESMTFGFVARAHAFLKEDENG